jgi:hypothetical protein
MIRCRIRHPSSGRLSMLAMSSHATRRGPHGKNKPIPRVSGQRTGPPSKSNRAPVILIEPPIGSLLQERPRFPVGVSVTGLSQSGPETYRSTAPTPASSLTARGTRPARDGVPSPRGRDTLTYPHYSSLLGGQPYKCPLIALAMAVIAATDRGWPLMANWQARFPRWSQ